MPLRLLLLLAALALFATGCETDTADLAPENELTDYTEADDEADPEFVIDDGAGVQEVPEVREVTVLTAELGDRGCYLTIEGEAAAATEIMAAYDVCGADADALVGNRYRATVEPGEVMAASCEGDPECPDTETVDMVTALEPIE